MSVKLRALKSWNNTNTGDIFITSKKGAENYVSQGFAEYVEEHIPKQLQNENFRFIKVRRRNKKPLEVGWPNKYNYPYNDMGLKAYIKNGGNYGVATGYGDLVVVDSDYKTTQELVEKHLPDTFRVSTGKGTHNYFICKDLKEKIVLGNDSEGHHYGEIQALGQQVVGAGSTHPNGHKYAVINDIPIAEVTKEQIEAALNSLFKKGKSTTKKKQTKTTEIVEQKQEDPIINKIKSKIKLTDLMKEFGYNLSKNPTMCMLGHDSEGEACFSYNDKTGLWNCFHCGEGGDLINFYTAHYKCDFIEAKKKLAKKIGLQIGLTDLQKEIVSLLKDGITEKRIKAALKKDPRWQGVTSMQQERDFAKAKKYLKKEKENTRHTSSFVDSYKKILVEQCYNKTGNVFYQFDYEKKQITRLKSFKCGTIKYLPCVGEEVYKKVIHLPEAPVDYGLEEDLDKEILAFIVKYLDIPEDILQFALWNIKRSWVFDKFHTLNYLRALGDTGQGKSRFLDTLGILHYKPLFTSGATTAAPIFRMIQKWGPTLIIDEADLGKSDESQDFIKIVNQGYERGKTIMRCDKNNHNNVNFFDPFCPKVIATRKPFQDKAVESRCITQIMKGTIRKDIPRNIDPTFFEKALEIRNKLLYWRFKTFFEIDTNQKVEFEEEIEPRIEQVISGLGFLFIGNKEKIEFFKKFVYRKQKELIEERQNSLQGQIVGVLSTLYNEGIRDISNKDILEREQLFDDYGKEIKERKLSSYLKELGIQHRDKPEKIDGKTKRCLDISFDYLQGLCKRYGYEVTKVTQVTVQGDKKQKVVSSSSNNNNNNNREYHNYRNLRNSVTEKRVKNKQQILALIPSEPEIIAVEDLQEKTKLEEAELEAIFSELKKAGEVYQPRAGFYQRL